VKPWLKRLLWILGILLVVFVAIQFIPVGTPIESEPATNAFKWSSTEAETLAVEACYDCHSNDPKVWIGVQIAPMKWLAQADQSRGTAVLNFSAWTGQPSEEEIAESIQSGEMAPWYYWIVHWNAKLSSAEQQTLIDGYKASLSQNTAEEIPAAISTLIEAQCSQCHSTGPALSYRTSSADQATQKLDDMISKGATLTDAEKQTLVDFYTGATGQ